MGFPLANPGLSGGLALWSLLLNVSGVITLRPIRAAEKAPVLADSGLQPTLTVRTTLDDLTAVPATEVAVRFDGQSRAACGTGRLQVVTIGKIRATVEGAFVSRVFTSLEASVNALWTGYIALRQSPEDGDVVPVIDQFHDKGRRRGAACNKEDPPLGTGDSDIEQAPFLGIRIPFGH